MNTKVYIAGTGAVSSAGSLGDAWTALISGKHSITSDSDRGLLGVIPEPYESSLNDLHYQKCYRSYDRVCLLALMASLDASRRSDLSGYGTIYGSSRGATISIEQQHLAFIENKRIHALTSPMTTAGTLSAAVAKHCVGEDAGLSLSVSSACATGLHALGVGYGMIKAGVLPGALVGGAEAANTDFTLQQLKEARVYSRKPESIDGFPYRPFGDSRDGMILGEGSAALVLSKEHSDVEVVGYGAATEKATMTGITGDGLKRSITAALNSAGLTPSNISVVVGHGAGTRRGDLAELNAYKSIFASEPPPLTSFKWLTGHMLGASAAFSLAMAVEGLRRGSMPMLPYPSELLGGVMEPVKLKSRSAVLVCGLGFGGNAGAVILVKE